MTRILSRLLAVYALRCAWRAWRARQRKPGTGGALYSAGRGIMGWDTGLSASWDGEQVKVALIDDPGYPHDGAVVLQTGDGRFVRIPGTLAPNGNDVTVEWRNDQPRIFAI